MLLQTDHTFTIENMQDGEHRTFRIQTQADDATFAPGKRVLSLLVGQSNHHDYRSFAFVSLCGDRITVWRSKRSEAEQPSDWEKYAKFLLKLQANRIDRYCILEACECRRCGELLTVPESIRRGIGPVCAKRE